MKIYKRQTGVTAGVKDHCFEIYAKRALRYEGGMDMTFPGSEWEMRPPGDLGFDAEKLARVQRWLLEVAE